MTHDDTEGNTSFGILLRVPANMELSSEAVYHVPRAATQGPVALLLLRLREAPYGYTRSMRNGLPHILGYVTVFKREGVLAFVGGSS